jgi:pimeloyl-ACP methyl ester carboxylesterase
MIETTAIASTDARQQSAAFRQLASSLPERDLITIGSATSNMNHLFGRSYRSVRERFQAITSVGLSHASAEGEPPRRYSLLGRGGLPALSYLAAGDPKGRRVLFIHGTPGDATDWSPFLKKVPTGQHRLAVDRPGFGESGPGKPVVTLSEQARSIAGQEPAIVVGSSYGGPVALQLAANHPEVVSGVLLVGSSGDPDREETHPLQRLASIKAISRLLPKALAHSNAELLALRRELEELGNGLGRIRAPVTILQGLRDTLVPAENAAYIAGGLVGAMSRRVILVEQAGHFLHILSSDLVEKALGHVLVDADRG